MTKNAVLLYSESREKSKMGILRRPGICWILLAAATGLAAQTNAACAGPQQLTANLRTHPTTENAIQLGNWFAGHKQFECAADTFRGALKTHPESAQLNYLEALALVESGHSGSAVLLLQNSIRLDPDVRQAAPASCQSLRSYRPARTGRGAVEAGSGHRSEE